MGPFLIIVVGCIYAFVAIDCVKRGNWPLALTFACYAGSNIGLYYLAIKEP